ncbi:MAG: hypothetical protein HYR72_20955 [Deltaproteobacteria bacterium]|nr:hypothetical protein [Deltaproteobacteria bacterium]MBI3391005.1 hypothetical protein [Deltaproteobacteria bacterium]
MMQQRCKSLALMVAILMAAAVPLRAGTTEPRLALMRATAVRSTAGRITLTLEGNFSLGDTVQLALPLDVLVTQGEVAARFDLAGDPPTGLNQPAPDAGVISIGERAITLVLPAQFMAGEATAQIVATFDGKPLASNRLRFTL